MHKGLSCKDRTKVESWRMQPCKTVCMIGLLLFLQGCTAQDPGLHRQQQEQDYAQTSASTHPGDTGLGNPEGTDKQQAGEQTVADDNSSMHHQDRHQHEDYQHAGHQHYHAQHHIQHDPHQHSNHHDVGQQQGSEDQAAETPAAPQQQDPVASGSNQASQGTEAGSAPASIDKARGVDDDPDFFRPADTSSSASGSSSDLAGSALGEAQQQQQQTGGQDQGSANSTEIVSAEGKATAPAAPSSVPSPLGSITADNISSMLGTSEALLLDPTKRDVAKSLEGLRNLSALVDQAIGAVVSHRRKMKSGAGGSPTAPGPDPQVSDEASGSPAAAEEAEALAYGKSLTHVLTNWPNAGIDIAGKAVYALSVLQRYGWAGELLPRDPAAAWLKLHHAARAGNTEALLALADRFFNGVDVEENCTMAASYAKVAAQQVVLDVDRHQRYSPWLAPLHLRERWMNAGYIAADDAENAPHVIQYDEDLALRGNAEAQRRMAYRRLVGRGIEPDLEGAFHDFEAAAGQGDMYAIFNLGYMWLRGMHVPVNHTKAKELFEQAAEKGLGSGYNGLGIMYWNGQGTPANLTAAYEAFKKGTLLNNPDSWYNLGIMVSNGLATEKNDTYAFECFSNADKYGHWRAPYTLAALYEAGTGTEKNCSQARTHYRRFFLERSRWNDELQLAAQLLDEGDAWGALLQYTLVADQGSDFATVNAAWMLRQGLGYDGPDRLDIAAALYERAAKRGSPTGMVELAYMLYEAEGLGLRRFERNLTRVVQLFDQAAALNSSEALFNLGWCYQHGVGVEANATRAQELYRKSISAVSKGAAHAVAASIALVGLRVDRWIQPFFGPHATYRLCQWLQASVSSLAQAAEAGTAGSPQAQGAVALLMSLAKQAAALLDSLQLSQADPENLLMTVLMGTLAVVLYLRQRQLRS